MLQNTNALDKLPPHSSDIEKAVIGALLIESDAYPRVCDILTADCFYERKNQVIYESIKALNNEGRPADMLSVVQHLLSVDKINVAGGAEYVFEASSSMLSSAYLEHHANLLASLATRRKLIEFGQSLGTKAYDESEDVDRLVSTSSENLADIIAGKQQKVFSLTNTISAIGDVMRKNAEEPESNNATPTGFPFLDKKGGLQEGNLIIIAGETSMGKTSFANSITLSAIKNERRVAFYSLEMTKEQLTARLLSRGSKISSNRILNDVLDAREQHLVNEQRAELIRYGNNLLFDDTSTSSIDKILASIRAMKMRYDIHGVVIDYLQILNVNMRNTNKEQAMGDVARRLKNTAKDLKIWVVALSQLNRDNQNPEPSLGRIRDSGQIAEAADVVMLVYRPEYYSRKYPKPFENVETQGTAMIDVAKGRNIGVGKFICGFDSFTTSFYPLDIVPQINYKKQEEKPTEELAPF